MADRADMLIIDNYGVVLIGKSKIQNINVHFNLFKIRRQLVQEGEE